MLYLYDNAMVEDLEKSFDRRHVPNPVVKVIAPEKVVGIAAQIQSDQISFPLVALTRDENTPIDKDRINFTRAHLGVCSVLDKVTNQLYYERAIPVKLSYKLTILTTNTADMDELLKEVLFKYTSMYFLTIQLPYECDRKVRFGISALSEDNIERSSGNVEYITGGTLYQSIIPLVCEGCVMVSYTPAHLRRSVHEIEARLPGETE